MDPPVYLPTCVSCLRFPAFPTLSRTGIRGSLSGPRALPSRRLAGLRARREAAGT